MEAAYTNFLLFFTELRKPPLQTSVENKNISEWFPVGRGGKVPVGPLCRAQAGNSAGFELWLLPPMRTLWR
ncbi:MAG: hypothetical protein BA863_03005 [Desulfovibrio sp. S3730MH75]|nr:MAG: hypothetical protein BA863_03005 [Desulfovibrio sp. S3730MH75]